MTGQASGLRAALSLDFPGTARIKVARLKARAPVALGDCLAMATAAAHDLLLLTGDPRLSNSQTGPAK